MLRASLLGLVVLAARRPRAGRGRYRDLPECHGRNRSHASAACESVIADDKITGPSRAAAFWFRGDSLMKKRDYDGAIAAFTTAHGSRPDNIGVINARGIAYS